MKKCYGKLLVLAMVFVLVVTAMPCLAVEGKGSCDKDKPRHKKMELTEEKIDRIMGRIKEANPEKAEELEKLRKDKPEEFKAELRKSMREHFGKMRGKGPGWQGECEGEKGQRRPRRPGGPEMMGGSGGGGGGGFRGGGPRGGGGGHGWSEKGEMAERHKRYMEWLKENDPEEAEKLAKLREKNPQLHSKRMGLGYRKHRPMMEAARENPELAEIMKEDHELRRERDRLVRKIKAAKEDEKKELVAELEKVIGSRFDLITRRKQIRYEMLQKKLARLQEQITKSEAEVEKWKAPGFKEENTKKRLEKLVSDSAEFKWNE